MKVLLCEDVNKLGWLGDIVEVAEGYATVGHPTGLDPHKVPQLFPLWYLSLIHI